MNAAEVLEKLESYGTEQNRKVYAKHGVSRKMFGVSFANLNALKKLINKDHRLATELWKSGNHDARILATMIADPKKAEESLIDDWVEDLDNYIISDAFSKFVFETDAAKAKMEEWINCDDEWIARTGWLLAAHLAMKNKALTDKYFLNLLKIIENKIHHKKNRTRDAMNNALIAIGMRNENLENSALKSAEKIGKVKVDHGETDCKTPDAKAYILKVKKRKSK